ncbi:PREDICTED: probable F-box protein At1g53815 [Camelina sativa]|uniref:Probable F-box protein At1g53815 n=1 Tax=Camelina sativa TaxID=90675 RepID=A0ABM0VZ68_CAMSA|nr:PREDICTED: probable F-box protein At1g53815 [Camelina sativa]
MTKRKQHVTGDDSVIDLIPVDLVIRILSRLPVKSMAQCRCVSKFWSSIIRRPNYNLLFPKSPATPRFLFIVKNGLYGLNMFIYSSPQPQNPDKYQSLVATLHTRSATDYCSKISPPVNGLVCHQYTGKDHIYAVISNPITGEYVRTPEVTREAIHTSREKTYFGYDPIEKQFKVMCMTWLSCGGSHEYQVLTLGTGKFSSNNRKVMKNWLLS